MSCDVLQFLRWSRLPRRSYDFLQFVDFMMAQVDHDIETLHVWLELNLNFELWMRRNCAIWTQHRIPIFDKLSSSLDIESKIPTIISFTWSTVGLHAVLVWSRPVTRLVNRMKLFKEIRAMHSNSYNSWELDFIWSPPPQLCVVVYISRDPKLIN